MLFYATLRNAMLCYATPCLARICKWALDLAAGREQRRWLYMAGHAKDGTLLVAHQAHIHDDDDDDDDDDADDDDDPHHDEDITDKDVAER